MKKVLITGAAGFIGSQLVQAFAREGHEVRASDIPGADFSIAERCGAEVAPANLLDADRLKEVTAGVDIVVNTAAIFDLSAPYKKMRAVNVDGVDGMCRAALESGVGHFIQFSSVAVYGIPKNIPCREEEEKRPCEPYGRTKWEGEQVAMRYYRDNGLPVSVLRPALVYGPGGRYGLALYVGAMAMFKYGRRGPLIIDGGPLTHNVHVEDVARATLLLAGADGVIGKVFNVADEDPIRAGDMFLAIMAPFDLKPRRVIRYIPWLWKSLAWTAHTFAPNDMKHLTNRGAKIWAKLIRKYDLQPTLEFKVDKGWLSYMRGDQCYDNTSIKSLGLTLKHPNFTEGIRDTIHWYQENRWIPDFNERPPGKKAEQEK